MGGADQSVGRERRLNQRLYVGTIVCALRPRRQRARE